VLCEAILFICGARFAFSTRHNNNNNNERENENENNKIIGKVESRKWQLKSCELFPFKQENQ